MPQSLFQKYFRLNKPAFEYLLKVVTTHTQPARKQFAISPVVKISACLRFFAEGGYQTSVGKEHDVGLAQSSFRKALADILFIFEQYLCPRWIQLPVTAEEKSKIATAFYIKHKIPPVVGCVDGTPVKIIAPSENSHLYYNRKGYYSLNVMLVCDHELKIRHVDASHPGASHDSLIWNVSELRSHFETQFSNHQRTFWLLSDAGYSLEPWLIAPYRTPNQAEIKFNEMHSKCRNIIERTNGVLKNRWRCILGGRELHYAPEKAAQIVNVTCCLHNICIHFRANIPHTPDAEAELNLPEIHDVHSNIPTQNMEVARSIRNNIRDSLNN
ncbi:putative nuclease HARBI1 [Anastrepha ludens]|uniref:putative nuclease HARBI1 n=1 Tax=Anastrepha ludens TaxID=28586 RepID=UPI0023AEE3DF|nr:putative nuclease HARBI1 [Anastrepha ludens]